MRTVLLGTDFMFNSSGDLVPIEINTNLGIEKFTFETVDEIFNLDDLSLFISSNNFTSVAYIGALRKLDAKLITFCDNLGLTYEFYEISNSLTVPYVEDTSEKLIIRSAYDTTAIVDDDYCKNKPNFLKLISTKPYSSQYAYINDNGDLVNNITTIPDNGNHPNFILKGSIPAYNKEPYPKLYKVNNQSELDTILLNVSSNCFLTEFHYNPDKIYLEHIIVYRSYNLLFPPDLNSIKIGQHVKLTGNKIDEISTYDMMTFELNINDKSKYITSDGGITIPKLMDDDDVEMADGTFKSGLDLEIGDLVKTIDIPNPNNVDISNMTVNYHIDYDTFLSGTTYSTNIVLDKVRVDKLVNYVKITFTDLTTWEDTSESSYLILRNNEVRFAYLESENFENSLNAGDEVILINTSYDNLTTTLKTVLSVDIIQQIFGGWEITIEGEHLFLTRNSNSIESFVSIEHNATCNGSTSCTQQLTCPKGKCCCTGNICGGCT